MTLISLIYEIVETKKNFENIKRMAKLSVEINVLRNKANNEPIKNGGISESL